MHDSKTLKQKSVTKNLVRIDSEILKSLLQPESSLNDCSMIDHGRKPSSELILALSNLD